MARKARVKNAGAVYHVIQRGNNQEYVFQEPRDKNYLLKQLRELKLGMGFKVYAYVIMDNHYHLMLQTLGEDLNKVMQRLNSKYGSYYNNCYERSGHVFQGRYKSSIILDERYLFTVLWYIHHNPVRAGITGSVSEYHWSSDRIYRKNITNGLVDVGYIMDRFSLNRAQANARYRQFMEKVPEEEDKKELKVVVVGDKGDEDCKLPLDVTNEANEANNRRSYERKSLDNILREVALDHREYELIKQGSRQRLLTNTKLRYINLALQWQYTHEEIGQGIGVSDAGIRKLLIRNQ